MRYAPTESDKDELARLNPEPWMVELLSLNPGYCSWGPHEDYMWKEGNGWDSAVIYEEWKGNALGLDELNEVANFYFSINRDGHDCPHCQGSGLNPETHRISESFYAHDGKGGRWCDNITQDEVQALCDAGRLHDFTSKFVPGEGWVKTGTIPTAAEVNAWESKGMGHDAINRWILIEARAKRLGVYGHCDKCNGGTVFDEPQAHLSLTLWVLHPRKGCSRGWEYTRIQKEDLPEIFAFLREAAQRNADRFSKVPIPATT